MLLAKAHTHTYIWYMNKQHNSSQWTLHSWKSYANTFSVLFHFVVGPELVIEKSINVFYFYYYFKFNAFTYIYTIVYYYVPCFMLLPFIKWQSIIFWWEEIVFWFDFSQIDELRNSSITIQLHLQKQCGVFYHHSLDTVLSFQVILITGK